MPENEAILYWEQYIRTEDVNKSIGWDMGDWFCNEIEDFLRSRANNDGFSGELGFTTIMGPEITTFRATSELTDDQDKKLTLDPDKVIQVDSEGFTIKEQNALPKTNN